MNEKPKKNFFVAFDQMNKKEIFYFLEKYQSSIGGIKIGLENYTRYGEQLLFDLKNKFDLPLFLDLKLHDIPVTISSTLKVLTHLPIDYLTLHVSGGREMLMRAQEVIQNKQSSLKLLGVSLLTSLGPDDFHQLWNIEATEVPSLFEAYFKLIHETKLAGMVLSAEDLYLYHSFKNNSPFAHSAPLEIFCPGIRFSCDEPQDQKRVVTPEIAWELGAHQLVIGRALTQSLSQEERIAHLNLEMK